MKLNPETDGGVSKVKLAFGAASLFLFLVGLKRSFRREDGSEILSNGEQFAADGSPLLPEEQRLRNAS